MATMLPIHAIFKGIPHDIEVNVMYLCKSLWKQYLICSMCIAFRPELDRSIEAAGADAAALGCNCRDWLDLEYRGGRMIYCARQSKNRSVVDALAVT